MVIRMPTSINYFILKSQDNIFVIEIVILSAKYLHSHDEIMV